jgi:hypothetical protein
VNSMCSIGLKLERWTGIWKKAILLQSQLAGIALMPCKPQECAWLNYATSSLYIAAKYLGIAELVRRDLKEQLLSVPSNAREEMQCLISNVRESLQGKTGAGIVGEQQESIGEIVWGLDDRVITNCEFRRRLLEPGWEQFVGLFRFYVHLHKKLEHEVTCAIDAIDPLVGEVHRLCDCKSHRDYEALRHGLSKVRPGSALTNLTRQGLRP